MSDFKGQCVSVIIPVYNAAAFLETAVDSALRQAEVGEVILIEDGSTDNSLDVCEFLQGRNTRIRLFRHPDGGNRGAGATRNLGIRNCSLPFIAFLDADDEFLEERFRSERALFNKYEDCEGVYSAIGTKYIDAELRNDYIDKFRSEVTTVSTKVDPSHLFEALLTRNGFGYFSLDALTIRSHAVRSSSLIFQEGLRLHQDTDFIIRLAFKCRLYPGSIDQPVALRGVHGNNRITRNRNEAQTRSDLYRGLLDWGLANGIKQLAERSLRRRYMINRIMATQSRIELIALFRQYYGRLWMLNNPDIRTLHFDKIFGRGTSLSRLFDRTTWILLNRMLNVD